MTDKHAYPSCGQTLATRTSLLKNLVISGLLGGSTLFACIAMANESSNATSNKTSNILFLEFSLEDPANDQPRSAFPDITVPPTPFGETQNTRNTPAESVESIPKRIEELIESPLPKILEQNPVNSLENRSNPLDISLESLEQETSSSASQVMDKNHILILKVVDYRDENFLKIDSNSRIQLNQTLQQALHHEISVFFNVRMQLTETNRLLGIRYQRTRKDIDYHIQLSRQGIDRKFVLHNLRNGQKQFLPDLDSALETLSTIQDFKIAELSELHPKQNYTLRIRIALDRKKLPAPLILQAYSDARWQLDSGWFETTLTAPQSWQ